MSFYIVCSCGTEPMSQINFSNYKKSSRLQTHLLAEGWSLFANLRACSLLRGRHLEQNIFNQPLRQFVSLHVITLFASHPAHRMFVPAVGLLLDVRFGGNICFRAINCLVAYCRSSKSNVSEETSVVAQIVAEHHSLGSNLVFMISTMEV